MLIVAPFDVAVPFAASELSHLYLKLDTPLVASDADRVIVTLEVRHAVDELFAEQAGFTVSSLY
jgi:hypothetical protein